MGTNTVSQNSSSNSLEAIQSNPQVPDYVGTPVGHLFSGIDNYLQTDPGQTVTPMNGIQWDAINKGNSFGQNAGGWNAATNAVTGLLGSSTQGAQAPGAPGVTKVGLPSSPLVTRATNATLADPAAASAASAGKAATVGLMDYNPALAGSKGYSASLVGDTGNLLPGTARTISGASLLDNLDAYKNPATQALVNATLAQYDNSTGQARAAMQRAAAGSGAFSGSRYGIAQGQFEADSQRNRALTDAELRAAAFDRATTLSGQDADRRQGADTFNASAQNALDLNRGQMRLSGLLADQTARNDAGRFGADAYNQAEKFNAGATNDAGRFGADAFNTGQQFNANASNTFALADADRRQQAGLLNTQTQNDFATRRFDASNDLSKFNAGATNDMAGKWFDAAVGNSRQDAQAANDASSLAYSTNADLSKFNANLGLQDRQLGLSAAGLLGDLTGQQSADQRDNAAAQLAMGNALWSLDDKQKQALLTQLQNAGGLLSPALIEALSGKYMSTSGTTSGNKSETGSNGIAENAIGKGLGFLALGLSERRFKRDIALVGRAPDGLGIYDFRYVWDDDAQPLRRGTMVDEVERLRPWALGPVLGGFRTVNYGAL